MQSKFDDENISLMNYNRIDFPLYTQLDIFKFLRAYDLQKSCINVSKEWRNTIRRYAGELPKFRDQRDRQAIERLVVGETLLNRNQRLSEAYYQRVEGVKRKRNLSYFIAAATVVTLLILGIASSILVLHNLHHDEEKSSRTINSISQQDQSSERAIINEDEISGGSISDEILALVALSMTTIFFIQYCVWPGKPYLLILYASSRVALLCIPSFVKIPNNATGLNPSIKWSIVLLLYPFEVLFWIAGTCYNVHKKFNSIWLYDDALRLYGYTLLPPIFSTILSLLLIHFWNSKGITVPSLVTLVAILFVQSFLDLIYDSGNEFHLKDKITLVFWIINAILIIWKGLLVPFAPALSVSLAPWLFWITFVCFHPVETFFAFFLLLRNVYSVVKENWKIYAPVPPLKEYNGFG